MLSAAGRGGWKSLVAGTQHLRWLAYLELDESAKVYTSERGIRATRGYNFSPVARGHRAARPGSGQGGGAEDGAGKRTLSSRRAAAPPAGQVL